VNRWQRAGPLVPCCKKRIEAAWVGCVRTIAPFRVDATADPLPDRLGER
jgi:hypothetical protein